MADAASEPCHCGGAAGFDGCCGPLLAGTARATTAEQLMRSRYTAYCMLDRAYLERTWDPATRPVMITLLAATEWLGLEVLDVVGGEMLDTEGVVEFVATYRQGATVGTVHERSRFRQHGGRWLYVGADERG